MNKAFIFSLSIVAISFQAFAQNSGVDYVSQLRKGNPLYSAFKGSFSVTDHGAATYVIPFTTTPGIGGMTPQISISYNSNYSSTIIGEGWSLNGFSIIGRVGNINAIDGFSQSVSFDETDNLQLDGQRLIPEKENHGVNGARYYTENNLFKRITIASSKGGNSINNVQYFKVETKEGLEYYYGDIEKPMMVSMGLETLSRSVDGNGLKGIVMSKAQGVNNVPFLWLVTLIKDKNDNWIYFNYNFDDNFYSPKEIWYGGNGSSAIGEIVFSYAESFGKLPNKLGWSSLKYLRGESVLINKPLTRVSSFYIDNDSKKVVREYNLEYTKDATSNKLMLAKVFQSTIGHLNENNVDTYSNKMQDTVNSIVFNWSKSNKETKFKDVFVTKENILLEEDYKIAISDFNGDGFPDKLMHKNFGNKVVYLMSANNKSGSFISNSKPDTIKTNIAFNAKSFTGDFNADGCNDILYVSNDKNKMSLYVYYSKINADGKFINFKEFYKKNIIEFPEIEFNDIQFEIGDLNSDGYSDIVIYYLNESLHYQSIKFSRDSISLSMLESHDKGSIPKRNYASQSIDINGDGITDLLFSWTDDNGWHVRSYLLSSSKNEISLKISESESEKSLIKSINNLIIKTLNGFSEMDIRNMVESEKLKLTSLDSLFETGTNFTVADGDYSRLRNIMYADINRDGNIDIVISNTDLEGWTIYYTLGKGDGSFTTYTKLEICKIRFPYNHKSSFGDFNGDGNLDLIIQKSDTNGWYQLIAYGNGKGEFSLAKSNEDFKNLVRNNFAYSQRFVTDYVMPIGSATFLGLYKFFQTNKIQQVVSCELKPTEIVSTGLCFMKNIRQIFPIETGFYPDEKRPFQNAMNDPVNNFIPQNLKNEGNIKRILECDFHGDSSVNILGESYKYYTRLTYSDYWLPFVVDLNGDGVSDLLLTYPRQIPNDSVLRINQNDLEKGLFTFIAINTSYKTGFIKEIIHSNKSKILIEYKSSKLGLTNLFPKTNLNYPNCYSNNVFTTVSKVGTSNGVNNDSLNYTSYNYCNPIISLNGRGFIGFQYSIVTNMQNNNKFIKTFLVKDDYLEFGLMPLKISQTYVDGFRYKISESNYEYCFKENEFNKKIYNLFNSKTISHTKDTLGLETSYSESQYEYDSFGNLKKAITKRGYGLNEIVQEVNNIYYETFEDKWTKNNNWIIGRLKESIITTARSDLKVIRKASFEYNDTTGQLVKEVSNVDSSLSLTKIYRYDRFGNIKESIVFPTNAQTPELIKVNQTVYSKDNRFVEEFIDAGGYSTTKYTEPILGLIKEISFANEHKTKHILDEFGRLKSSLSPEGVETRSELRICRNCDYKDYAAYFSIETTSLSDFKVPLVLFYDNNGRVIRKVQYDHRLNKIITEFEYDIYGNLIRSSLPYFEHDKLVANTFHKYDKLNRKISTTLPNGANIKFEYLGLAEKVINDKGQISISFKNILGELERSIDDNGFYINYTYDCFGRIISINDKDNRVYKMEYDLNGNLTSYLNPNFNEKETSVYDVFGRKIKFVTPLGDELLYTYDKLDRLIQKKTIRQGEEAFVKFSYVNQEDKVFGKGKLDSIVSNSEDQPFNEFFVYDEKAQLKLHTYEVRKETNRRNQSWLYEPHHTTRDKNKFTYRYEYTSGLLTTITYPTTGISNDKLVLIVNYKYNNGTLTEAIGNVNKKQIEFWKLLETNSFGSPTLYRLGNKIIAPQKYDLQNNQVLSIKYSNQFNIIAGIKYDYDKLGNLTYRQDLRDTSLYDSIYYDNLNRILAVKNNNYTTSVKYDGSGDILLKQYGNDYLFEYTYIDKSNKFNKINLVNPTSGKILKEQSITYDDYGNMEQIIYPYLFSSSSNKFEIEYNQFNQPKSVNNYLFFYYSFDGAKIASYNSYSNTGIAYLGNLSEYFYSLQVRSKSKLKLDYQKANILVYGKVVAHFYTNNGKIEYLLKDASNTVIAVADSLANIDDDNRFSFDVWGLRRNGKTWKYDWSELINLANGDGTDLDSRKRGFLNNITLDGLRLVDMNARLYDPFSGRFISVDQITSNSISSTQFTNPYLYCYNNPTVFADANGKFPVFLVLAAAYIGASTVGGSFLPWEWNDDWWKGAIVGAAGAFAGGLVSSSILATSGALTASEAVGAAIASGFATGFSAGFTSTLVNGGNFLNAIENGLVNGTLGGVTSGFTFGIGEFFANKEGFISELTKASFHGLNQGVAHEAMGGSFEHGFLAGSFVSLAQQPTLLASTPEQKVVISSIVGGTVSSLGGGKFANGALSAAFIQMYNHNSQHGSSPKIGELELTDVEGSTIKCGYSIGNYFNINQSGEFSLPLNKITSSFGLGPSFSFSPSTRTISLGLGIGFPGLNASIGNIIGAKFGYYTQFTFGGIGYGCEFIPSAEAIRKNYIYGQIGTID